MEQKRLLAAIALSFLVFFLWSVVFSPKPQDNGTLPEQQSAIEEKATENSPAQSPEAAKPLVSEPRATVDNSRPARQITVENQLFRMTLSEKGGAVTSMVLKNYRETVDKDSPLKEIITEEVQTGSVLLNTVGEGNPELAQGNYELDRPDRELTVQQQPETIRFRYVDAQGLQVEKAYTFSPNTYLVGLTITVYNGSQTPLQKSLALSLRQKVGNNGSSYGFQGPSALLNDSLKQVEIKKIEEQEKLEGKVRWTAIENHYFMSSLLVQNLEQARIALSYEDPVVTNQLILNNAQIEPLQKQTFDFDLFMGPKSLKVLRGLNNELDRAINFGWFDFIAKPCLWFMNFIFKFIPNYGVAIIILTIVTRLIFWPLAGKSYKSMNEMRKIQPLMQEIREKHKNDKNKMNQEMMALYRTYKINPMGGCLPMLIQLPVFFALYQMLYQAIELRHAPFMLWINDLSAPDRLFHFGFSIPFMQPPYGIPVLTLIMGASMFVQQKMSPAPGDPAQAKMMMLMPIVFTFIFINFSSGLVLYWLVSNIISIAQQYYTQKKTA